MPRRSTKFRRTDAAVAVRVRGFEPLLNEGKILILIECLVVIAVGGGEFLAAHATAKFLEVERTVFVSVELVKRLGRSLLRFGKIDCAVVICVETFGGGRLVAFR